MNKFILISIIFFLTSCSLSPIAIESTERSPAALQCRNLIEKLSLSNKEIKISDILTSEKLALYGYKLKGSKLYDKDGKLLGSLKLENIETFYQWGPINDQVEQYANGGILQREMDYILKSEQQAYGRGFYVSKDPFDSHSYGNGLTIFKADGPVLVMDYVDLRGETPKIAKSFSDLGIDAYRGTATWFSMLTTKHLKTIGENEIISDRRWKNFEKRYDILNIAAKLIASRTLDSLDPALMKTLKDQIFKKITSEKFVLNEHVDGVEDLASQIQIKNKWAKLLEYVSLEHVFKVMNKTEVVEGKSIKELFDFAEKTEAGRKQVSLDRIQSGKTFRKQLRYILDHDVKIRDYDVVMSPDTKSETQEIQLKEFEMRVIKANKLLTVTNEVSKDTDFTTALVTYAEMKNLVDLAKRLPISGELKQYISENKKFLTSNPSAQPTKMTYKKLLGEITELFFTDVGRKSILREVHGQGQTALRSDSGPVLLYTAFMALHPFQDGNGRAGRLMYEYLTLAMKGRSEKMVLFDYNDDLLRYPRPLIESLSHSKLGQIYIDFLNPRSADDFKALTEQMLKVYKGI